MTSSGDMPEGPVQSTTDAGCAWWWWIVALLIIIFIIYWSMTGQRATQPVGPTTPTAPPAATEPATPRSDSGTSNPPARTP